MFEEEKIEQRILYNNNDLEITKYTEEEKKFNIKYKRGRSLKINN